MKLIKKGNEKFYSYMQTFIVRRTYPTSPRTFPVEADSFPNDNHHYLLLNMPFHNSSEPLRDGPA
jgi:hypothetical protein